MEDVRRELMAAGESQSVRLPRSTSERSYSGQLPTRYLILYFGCTLDRLLDIALASPLDERDIDIMRLDP